MLVLVTYDVSTEDADGKRRLRNVAKRCGAYGQRVQNSVFECYIDEAQYRMLKSVLTKEINQQRDSLRFYKLGNQYEAKVEHVGTKAGFSSDSVLMV